MFVSTDAVSRAQIQAYAAPAGSCSESTSANVADPPHVRPTDAA